VAATAFALAAVATVEVACQWAMSTSTPETTPWTALPTVEPGVVPTSTQMTPAMPAAPPSVERMVERLGSLSSRFLLFPYGRRAGSPRLGAHDAVLGVVELALVIDHGRLGF